MSEFYERPTAGSKTRRVWDIADELTRAGNRPAERSEVIRRYEAEGGNYNTASTQYHHWKKSRQAEPSSLPDQKPLYFSVEVKEAGRVLLPAAIRAALGVDEGQVLQGVVKGGELLLMTRDTAIQRAQALVRTRVAPGISLVDQLIADRRAENERESH
jgi:bifunctional DNA-binding transcriptional regulator/antitoxin component of YhaV-PrlF toxin-antitoxin module